ncbi:hypothetical protein T10_181 [Trichinella papuae]|uniref:Uncharacterized protein n=1 Tax=Trichinella papuae TaxID=268474 RepID=A0A0V1M1F3_9BILA|nr:hypothetical protein T10_181 [Trichinella papuae]
MSKSKTGSVVYITEVMSIIQAGETKSIPSVHRAQPRLSPIQTLVVSAPLARRAREELPFSHV